MNNLFTTTPLLLDGAMGTELHARGHSYDQPLAHINLTHPQDVAQVHRAYIEAGADIITTNTFQPLAQMTETAAAFEAGVRIARAAIVGQNRPILLAASLGPLLLKRDPQTAFARYQAQIKAVTTAPIDLLLLETMLIPAEIFAAIAAARAIVPAMPIIVSIALSEAAYAIQAADVGKIGRKLATHHLTAIGTNCSPILSQTLQILSTLQQAAPQLPLIAYLNAGNPPSTPHDFATATVTPLLQAGVKLIGGCCGTTPAHIACLRTKL